MVYCYYIQWYHLQSKESELSAKDVSLPVAASSLAAYSKGSTASYKKLSRFFGEEPPRVESLETLLDELGYVEYLPVRIS